MVKILIDDHSLEINEGATILDAACQAGIPIPTLCYYKDLCAIGACRLCLVELEGTDRLTTACNTIAEEGMVIRTNTPRVRQARRVNLELILADHNNNCPHCSRNMNCSLQQIAKTLNIKDTPYPANIRCKEWPEEHPLLKDDSKCVYCMRCLAVCNDIQSLGVWDLFGTASNLKIDLKNAKSITDVHNCVLCGQCITHCPVGALSARDDTDKVIAALNDPEQVVIFQIAPAIRTAWGEPFGLSEAEATVGKMVAAVKATGADYVFDTSFSADMTIMEEGTELLERLKNRDQYQWPMFTSCCPAWVRFVKSQYPDLVGNLSTAKSPQQMFGATAKTWFAQSKKIDPQKIFLVSVMPCVAKKQESALPNINGADAGLDVDAVLTNRELANLIGVFNVNVHQLEDQDFDDILGRRTGAGEIFGSTGGVTEAALRTLHFVLTGQNPDPDAYMSLRAVPGKPDLREATVEIGDLKIKAAIVSGLANTRQLLEEVRSGAVDYDFVEVMSCPGGCVGGGGQPIVCGANLEPEQQTQTRRKNLYEQDQQNATRFSHENPAVQQAYQEYFEKPLSHVSHKLLHTNHQGWDI